MVTRREAAIGNELVKRIDRPVAWRAGYFFLARRLSLIVVVVGCSHLVMDEATSLR